MAHKELNYAESIKRLDEILEDIDQSRVPIDVLADRVLEAAALLKRCKALLTETEAKVRDVLQVLDNAWKEHLAAMDHLRMGIHLRGYAQKQPKQEYKREAFELFAMLLDLVKNEVTRTLMTVLTYCYAVGFYNPEDIEDAIQEDPAVAGREHHVHHARRRLARLEHHQGLPHRFLRVPLGRLVVEVAEVEPAAAARAARLALASRAGRRRPSCPPGACRPARRSRGYRSG